MWFWQTVVVGRVWLNLQPEQFYATQFHCCCFLCLHLHHYYWHCHHCHHCQYQHSYHCVLQQCHHSISHDNRYTVTLTWWLFVIVVDSSCYHLVENVSSSFLKSFNCNTVKYKLHLPCWDRCPTDSKCQQYHNG